MAFLGVPARQVTWEAGIDVLSFGASKGGCMVAEAAVFFDPALAESFGHRRMRGGHLVSKMRFVSTQLEAYLSDGLWLKLARHANAMAQRLAQGLTATLPRLPGAKLLHPVEANERSQLPGASSPACAKPVSSSTTGRRKRGKPSDWSLRSIRKRPMLSSCSRLSGNSSVGPPEAALDTIN
jgi:hypothetical protein